MHIMKKSEITRLLPLLILALTATSCMTYKKVAYLQDMTENSQIALENKIEAVISPGDELTIIVNCYDPEIAQPFNLFSQQNNYLMTNSNYDGSGRGYLVDVDGYINFPILGKLKVSGLTRLKLQDMIADKLRKGNYISDPFVYVRFANFKIFFLGSNGGKAINVPSEHCTFLEALALSGDLDQFTRRDRIAVMREVDGKMTMRYLDPRSSKVFNDPYFVLRQNDFIVTQSFGGKYYMDEAQFWMNWVGIGSSLISTACLIIVANK